MKAAIFQNFGKSNQIIIDDVPVPVIRNDEILVEVTAASVNHVDTFVRAGTFKTAVTTPHIIGRDMVGTVTEIGKNVTGFNVGESVWTNSMGYDGRMGVTCEFVAVPQDRLYHIPKQVNPIQLVAAVHSSATASIILQRIMHAEAGQTILVEGAGGHVGTKLVQLAKELGLVITTTSASRDFEKLKMMGSARCLDYHDALDKLSNSFDHIIDTSGKVELETNLEHLNQGGEVTLITAPANNQFQFNVSQFYTNRKQLNGFVISHASVEELAEAAAQLNESFKRGHLLDDDITILSLTDARLAHEQMENGQHHRQRLVLSLKNQ